MAHAPSSPPVRVLFVEDSPDDVELILVELARHGYHCVPRAVETRPDFLDALNHGPWDVVLSDHSMREFSSLEALRLLREHDPDLPFIIVSGTIGEDSAVDAMRAGAQDYVLKHNLRRLGPAVARELREAENRRQQRRTQDALSHSENQLRHAQKLEAVGRLAGGVAHDFNNLLTVILGFSEFLLEQLPKDSGPFRDATEIQTAAQRASRLTKQLLAFSRQQVLNPQVVDLGVVLKELKPMLSRLIGEDVRCRLKLTEGALPVVIDAGQFEQVIMNLVVNARDAMPNGGRLLLDTARVTIDAERAHALSIATGEFVVVSVSDTGSGIPPSALDRIFEPFFTTKEIGQGTGLGLSMVFGIVRQSGGAIEVHTSPEEGTTFRVFFPVANRVSDPVAVEVRQVRVPTAAATILLAEDEPGVRTFLETALNRAGHSVISVASGKEAVRIGSTPGQRIDLLIADVVMPGLSGPEVAAQLATAQPEMRTIFLSGYSTHVALDDIMAADPSVLLQKPFTLEALLGKVRDRLLLPL